MRERESVPTSEARFPRWSTPVLAIVGGSLFVSGVFVLAAAGHAYSVATHLFILGSAIALAFPLLLVTLLVEGSEALLGRAWANGLRRLSPPGSTASRHLGPRAAVCFDPLARQRRRDVARHGRRAVLALGPETNETAFRIVLMSYMMRIGI